MPISPQKVVRCSGAICTNRITLSLLATLLACASPEGPSRPSPSASPERAWEAGYAPGLPLPDVPQVTGALAPRVIYPGRNALVAARDSNFIFGSVGSGDATLTINGTPVDVHANGAFLAWLPVPSEPTYELTVSRGAERVVLEHPVHLMPPRPALSIDDPLAVDSASVTPDSGLALRSDELVRVSVRATVDARAVLDTPDGGRYPLLRGQQRAEGGALFSADVPAATLARGATLVLQRNDEQLALRIAPVGQVDPAAPVYMQLGPDTPDDLDRVMVARPLPGGTYRWLLLPGTPVLVTGRSGTFSRVRLDASLEAWVNTADLEPRPFDAIPPRRVVSNMQVVPHEEWVDVVFPMSERPPFLIQENGRSITVTLYGVVANTDIITHVRSDTLVRHITWEQETSDRARYTLQLAHEPFGYVTFWEAGRFVLRVRRRPVVDERDPLRGMRIAVDAGHPPAGATGPTGLTEAEATLAIAIRLKDLLEARGAEVVMTRSSGEPVALADRPAMARQARAHALVSIHANALPDGVNPFRAHGTGTYYFHPHSDALARHVQAGMTGRLGLRDLGVYYDNLALVRPTWMPAILCEGAFMMIPEQEAALRNPEFQDRYARGVADGLESWFRALSIAP